MEFNADQFKEKTIETSNEETENKTETQNEHHEKNEEETFQEYFYDLQLNPEDFNKVILDVGAGDAYFAKWAKDHNVSSNIYSLEPVNKMAMKDKVILSTAEDIPMPNKYFDLIVSISAIPNIYLGDKNIKEKMTRGFYEMLRVLKDGGEIKLGHVLIGNKYESQKILTSSLEESLKELKGKFNIEINKIRTPQNDTYEYKNHEKTELLAESYLIIIKKLIQ